MNNKVKASVLITTYNHEKFIGQAIESALAQVTTFPYEILIGEDESQDSTRSIVVKYAKQYPKKIKLFLNSRKDVVYINGRATGRKNLLSLYKQSCGEYVAFLDGDDFWIDKNKLQIQADYLDMNPETSGCFCQARAFFEDIGNTEYLIPNLLSSKQLTIEDLLVNNSIAFCSVIYRRLYKQFPKWIWSTGMADWPIHILHAKYGPVGYIPKLMAGYRRHSLGSFSSRNKIDNINDIIDTYRIFNEYFSQRYHKIIEDRIKYYKAVRLTKRIITTNNSPLVTKILIKLLQTFS